MLVAANKQLYITLPKRQKMLLSRSIVNAVRSQNPPGRFLQKDGKTKFWFDVGDQKAQEKTSQALREGAPDIRKKVMATKGTAGDSTGATSTASTTTPAAPTSGDVSKSGAKRDGGGEKLQIPAHSSTASAVPFQQRKPESAASSAILSQTAGTGGGMIPPPEPLPYNPQQQQQMNTMYVGHGASGHMSLNERGMMIQNAMMNGGRSLNNNYQQPSHSANRFQQNYQQSQHQHQFNQQQDYQQQYQQQQQQHNNNVNYQRQRQRQQQYQQDQQQHFHGNSNHSMAASDVFAVPTTEGLDRDGQSFGSILMTDAEMYTLQLGSAHGPSKHQANRRHQESNNNYDNQNNNSGDAIPAAPMGGVLEPTGISIGDVSMHSAASNYQMKLEENGTSFGTIMSYNTLNTSLHSNNPDMVDGGLIDAVGSSFGSLSLDRNNRDILFKTLEIAGGGSEVPPMFRSETKSSANLLDCSDTESESSREKEALTKQKSQAWEMMKTQLEKQTSKGASVDSHDLMPPPVGFPQNSTYTNPNNHNNTASAADKFDDLVIALPPTTMESNFSTLSAWSAVDEETNDNDDDYDSQEDVVVIAPPPPQLTKTDSY
jgi:hypothetical protein